ncbi:TPA: helix-turn-helix domain-containing protein [Staphylococcus aureus]|nr:helix-turn-helix domain-containing protein [Staphylococcus aureus]
MAFQQLNGRTPFSRFLATPKQRSVSVPGTQYGQDMTRPDQGDHKGDQTADHAGVHLTTWSPRKAAEETGVSRSTIMRMLKKEEFPGARKINGQWAIPVTSLGVAGLRPGKPSPAEDSVVQKGDHGGVQGEHKGDHEHVRTGDQGDHLNTLNLRHKLELAELREQSLRKELEDQRVLASERAARIEDLKKALLMLERGSSDTPAPESSPEPSRQPTNDNTADSETPAVLSSTEAETAHEEEPKQPPQQGFFGRLRGLFS